MGCDIHLFVEYRKPDGKYWHNFGNQFRMNRHYGVFASLAGVRNRSGDIAPVSAPRGVPDDISSGTKSDYHIFIYDADPTGEGYCSSEQAEKWVNNGSSKMAGDRHVTDPDAHSGSWLTPDEYDKAINFTLPGNPPISDREDYIALLAAMRSLQTQGYEVRTVFWFDN